MKYKGRDIALWLGIGIFVFMLFQGFGSGGGREIPYSEFLKQVDNGQIREVQMSGANSANIEGSTADGVRFSTYNPETNNGPLVQSLMDQGVRFTGKSLRTQGLFLSVFLNLLPILLLLGFFLFMMRQSGGGGKGGPMSLDRKSVV